MFGFRIPRYKSLQIKRATGKNVGMIYVTLGGVMMTLTLTLTLTTLVAIGYLPLAVGRD